MSATELCGCCGNPRRASAPVVTVIVWSATQNRGYPLLPEDDYTVCLNNGCEAIALFVSRAATSHKGFKAEGPWTAAVVVFANRLTIKLELPVPLPASA